MENDTSNKPCLVFKIQFFNNIFITHKVFIICSDTRFILCTFHVRLEDSYFEGHMKDFFWEHNVLFSKGFFLT